MPQDLSSEQMLECGEAILEALAMSGGAKQTQIVPLSSFNIDWGTGGTDGSTKAHSQGALGAVHMAVEKAPLGSTAVCGLVSVRPTSFFSNFDAYDCPWLAAACRSHCA